MKRYTSYLLILALVAGLAGCGGGKEQNAGGQLDSKKAELVALQKEKADLDKKIAALEAEIAKLGGGKSGVAQVPVSVAAIEPKTFQHFIKVQGQITAENNVMVSPKTPGVYTQVLVKEGMNVSRGQLLGKVDDAVMVKSMAELETQLSLAKSLYEKQQNLWNQKIGSEVQLLQAKAQKDALEQKIATTQEQIAMSRITAPVSGVVEQVIAKPGEGAIPGAPAFTIVNLGDLVFKADLSESHLPFLKRGDKVTIEFPSVGQTLEASISHIGQVINPLNRTVTVTVNIPSKAELKANMVGEIAINDVTRENTITVAQQYIQKSAQGDFVMVVEKDSAGTYTAQRKVITTGLRAGDEVEVTNGLSRGSLLITDGFQNVSNGQPVRFSLTPAAQQ